jgi:hypothetical protein
MSEPITTLKNLGVLRDSMLGDGWYVIYTEHGPKDISRETIEKEFTK